MKLIGVSILLLQGNANFSIRSKKEIYPRKEVPENYVHYYVQLQTIKQNHRLPWQISLLNLCNNHLNGSICVKTSECRDEPGISIGVNLILK